ncbi:peptidylprolyl isomerase [Clostridium sp. Cult3]|uniref:peptidylprolyl isomerase n=1 Tax=Clostridium sp. Cult3 TaxID=2079004 RepID=UPI0023517EAD|nr:peptidylprolyl isomerase [Clostridium sp. Cult3]
MITIFLLTRCEKEKNTLPLKGEDNMELEQLQLPAKGEEIAEIKINYGTIKVRLFPDIAPKAVENFKTHAKDGYYDGVTFHRVISNFMIQGGDPEGTGRGGESIWGGPFEDEFDINYRNIRGALSMANAGPNTNGSQFFIVQGDQVDEDIIGQMKGLGEEKGYPIAVIKAYEDLGGAFWLDFKHTVFGQVFEGMDVVDEIARVETDRSDKPLEPVIIEEVRIVEFN